MALEAARAGARLLAGSGLPRPGGAAEVKGRGDCVTESEVLLELAAKAPQG